MNFFTFVIVLVLVVEVTAKSGLRRTFQRDGSGGDNGGGGS
jgi:hypothetical protein